MQPEHDKLKTATRVLKTVSVAIAHQLISTVGVIILSGELAFLLCSIARSWSPYFTSKLASKVLTQIPGFPVQAAVGLLLGFAFAKFMNRQIMFWVWLLPLALFCWTALHPPLNGSLFGPFYPPDTGRQIRLLDRLSYSLPFMASAGYALGAKLTRQRGWVPQI